MLDPMNVRAGTHERTTLRCGLALASLLTCSSIAVSAQAQTRRMHAVEPQAAARRLEPTGPAVAIDTTMGRIVCRLYDKEAPQTVANFIGLADGSKD
jgi:peptidyl-prolyl cis-trans isomerase A (cyclophilin A)